MNRAEGFLGTGLKKDEYVGDCSDIDDVIVFLRDGRMVITKVDDKKFIGKDIIHIAIFDKNDKRTIYNVIYRDGKSGASFVKRFIQTCNTFQLLIHRQKMHTLEPVQVPDRLGPRIYQ